MNMSVSNPYFVQEELGLTVSPALLTQDLVQNSVLAF